MSNLEAIITEALVVAKAQSVGDKSAHVVWDEKPVSFREFITSFDHMDFPSYSERQYQVVDFTLGNDPTAIFDNENSTAILEWGKGSGKDTIACHVIQYGVYVLLCMRRPQHKFPGITVRDTIDLVNVAYSADQALNVFFDKLKNNVLHWPWLKKKYPIRMSGKFVEPSDDWQFENVVTINKNSIFFPKRIRAFSRHSEQESTEGMNILFFVADEISAFKDKTQTRNASKVYNMLDSSSKSRFGTSVKGFLLSFPRYSGDFIEKMYDWAQDKIHVYADKAFTWQVKPESCFSGKWFEFEGYQVPLEFKEHFDRDPTDAKAKYMCLPPGAESPFVEKPEMVDFCIDEHRIPLIEFQDYVDGKYIKKRIVKWNMPSLLRNEHVITIDLGLKNDSAGFSIFHSERFAMPGQPQSIHYIQDAVTAWEPDPKQKLIVSFPDIETTIKLIASRIMVKGVYFDQWNSAQMSQNLKAAGINSDIYRLDLQDYRNCKEQFYFGKISLLNYAKQISEFKALEIIKGLRVDHPDGGCFVGDTRIPLLDGTLPTIAELAGKEVWVYSCASDGTIVPGKAQGRLTKYVKSLVDVVLDSGAVVRCTTNHLWMLRDGSYKQACDLISGIDRLMPCNRFWPVNGGYEAVSNKNAVKILTHHLVYRSLNGGWSDDNLVHHDNGNKIDNRPENLKLELRTEHSRRHTTHRHKVDLAWRENLYQKAQEFNLSDEGRRKHSEAMKTTMAQMSDEQKKNRARLHGGFRRDVDIQSLIKLCQQAENANEAARILNCGRNVIIRILKDNGMREWSEFKKGLNHKVRYVIPVNLTEPVPVYDLSVEKWSNFALSAGIFVHNSKDVADTVVGAVKVLLTPAGSIGLDEGEIVTENLSSMDDDGEMVSITSEMGEGVTAKFHKGQTLRV
jgi:hypothetical protein